MTSYCQGSLYCSQEAAGKKTSHENLKDNIHVWIPKTKLAEVSKMSLFLIQQHNPCVTTWSSSKNSSLNSLFVKVVPTRSLWSRQADSKPAEYRELQVSAGQNDSCQAVTDPFGWEHLLLLLRIPGILEPDLSYKRVADICHNLHHTC